MISRIATLVVAATMVAYQAPVFADENPAAATCAEELENLDTAMRQLGVQAPLGMPDYGVGYDMGAPRGPNRGQLWSLYQAALSLDQQGSEELCRQVVAEAKETLDEMEQQGTISTVTAPLLGGGCRVDTLVDLRVRNEAGDDLGHIKDVVIDLKGGKIDYALLAVGGFFDIGGKLFPIPWDAFEVAEDGRSFVLPVDKAALDDAPGFDRDVWPDMEDPEWSKTVHDFYAKVVQN